MKNLFFFFPIIFLIFATTLTKNSKKKLDKEIFDLKENIRFIRNTLKISKKFTKSKILYGGSVNPKNIKNLMRIDNIDGFLIGGASTNEKIFIDIMKKSIN